MSPLPPRRLNSIQTAIISWYRRERRDVPWRKTKDPYAIFVSEIMLQQTQVNRVREKLPVFLKRFPTLRQLARASSADVVLAWQGMGYNNRAVRLRDAARIVMDVHRGSFPRHVDVLRDLPGVGRYTSHAFACFALRQRVSVVDVNIRRVLSRLTERMHSLSDALEEQASWEIAEQFLPRDAYMWNQALMDLGATICTARKPLCDRCPVAKMCASRHLHKKRPEVKTVVTEEPRFLGIPRRLWRGKIVQVLRSTRGSVSLQELSRRLEIPASKSERLHEIVRHLEKDGIVRTRQYRNMPRFSLELN